MCSSLLDLAHGGDPKANTDLFHDFPMAHKVAVNQTGAFYFSQACSEDVLNFLLMIPIVFFRAMDVFFMAGVH